MPRIARVVTLCQGQTFAPTVEENVKAMLDRLRPVRAERPDIVCLPEAFATVTVPGTAAAIGTSVPGPITDPFAAFARANGCYVICPVIRKDGDRMLNAAVVLDRRGDIAGIYDKLCPVTGKSDYTCMEDGITPGTGAGVFDLDCGRIAIRICFDIEFPEVWQQAEEAGAEMIIWPSAYDGGLPLRLYAYMHGTYVVSSVRTARSRIIDPLGNVLHCTEAGNPFVSAAVNLEYMVCHNDYHHGVEEWAREKYGDAVAFRGMSEEGHMLVESTRAGLPLDTVVRELGLVPRREYVARHRPVYAAHHRNEPPLPQIPGFLGRPPYGSIPFADWEKTRQPGSKG